MILIMIMNHSYTLYINHAADSVIAPHKLYVFIGAVTYLTSLKITLLSKLVLLKENLFWCSLN